VRVSSRNLLTQEEIIKNAKAKHGDIYDYSKAKFVNTRTKIIITCPDHGDFEQTPNSHIIAGSGCPECNNRDMGIRNMMRAASKFVENSNIKHNNKFDYTKVDYVGCDQKVTITCPDHGDFEQTPSNHLRGRDCPRCVLITKGKRKTQKAAMRFVDDARAVHGHKYDYSKVDYVRSSKKINIICPVHGEFSQTPNSHLNGHGCGKCGGSQQLTTEEFVEKAKSIHGDWYDYSKVIYNKSIKPVIITCPDHGDFKITPNSHLSGSRCSKCARVSIGTTHRAKAALKFEGNARAKHGNKYDYSKVVYDDSKSPIIIGCPEHGDFLQKPTEHLAGHGCGKCSKTYRLTSEEFLEEAKFIHDDKYDYSKSIFVNNDTKLTITCPEHGDFVQKPSKHLRGQGCRSCRNTGIHWNSFRNMSEEDISQQGVLYVIRIFNDTEDIIKIGMTKRSVKLRYGNYLHRDGYNYEVILQTTKFNLLDTFAFEQHLLKYFRPSKYEPTTKFGGWTECFKYSSTLEAQIKKYIRSYKPKHVIPNDIIIPESSYPNIDWSQQDWGWSK